MPKPATKTELKCLFFNSTKGTMQKLTGFRMKSNRNPQKTVRVGIRVLALTRPSAVRIVRPPSETLKSSWLRRATRYGNGTVRTRGGNTHEARRLGARGGVTGAG